MKASGLPVEKEVSNLLFLADPENDSRMDLLVSETGKQRLAYDVQVVNNVALAQERNLRASIPGAQIMMAEAIKNAKYQAPCNDSGLGFKPLILTSQGNFSETLSNMISQTIDDFSKRANIPKSNVHPYWTHPAHLRGTPNGSGQGTTQSDGVKQRQAGQELRRSDGDE
jgi:hypothetical protein